MTNVDSADVCPVCRSGHFIRRLEKIAFVQSTDKGPVLCEVTVLVAACDRCDHKTWGSEAEALMRDAVRPAYDKLP